MAMTRSMCVVFWLDMNTTEQHVHAHEFITAEKLYDRLKTNLAKGFVSAGDQQQAVCLVLPDIHQGPTIGSGTPSLHSIADECRYAPKQLQIKSRRQAYPESVDRSRSTSCRCCQSFR